MYSWFKLLLAVYIILVKFHLSGQMNLSLFFFRMVCHYCRCFCDFSLSYDDITSHFMYPSAGCIPFQVAFSNMSLLMQVMVQNLEQVVSMVLNSFQDPHPRVRWAAINAVGQLSTDLGPKLQEKYHQLVLPALAGAMDDFQNPRVQVCNSALYSVLLHVP